MYTTLRCKYRVNTVSSESRRIGAVDELEHIRQENRPGRTRDVLGKGYGLGQDRSSYSYYLRYSPRLVNNTRPFVADRHYAFRLDGLYKLL
jgi:hypothetical protein